MFSNKFHLFQFRILEELRKKSDSKYKEWLSEQERLEVFKVAEAERIHDEENEKWMRTELLAQQQWRKLQEKLANARLERAQQDLLIKKVIYFCNKICNNILFVSLILIYF